MGPFFDELQNFLFQSKPFPHNSSAGATYLIKKKSET